MAKTLNPGDIIPTNSECPGCSGTLRSLADMPSMGRCERCGGLVSIFPVTRSQAERFVTLVFDHGEVLVEQTRYFDIVIATVLVDGRMTLDRVHGWFNPTTRKVVQFG